MVRQVPALLLTRPRMPGSPFAGHEFDAPGVFATNPRHAPGTVAWREAIPVGHCDLSPAEVHAVVQQMGAQYRGNRCAASPATTACPCRELRSPPAAAVWGRWRCGCLVAG